MLGWFRRHAVILMVVLGSAAMVIFGLGSVFDSIARSASEKVRENPTIAEWAGGKLTQDDVAGVYQNHAESVRFLNAVVEAAEEKSGDTVVSLAERVMPITGSEEDRMNSVLSRMMFAKAAEKQGFVVDNGLVDEYIALISGDAQLSPTDLDRINRSVNQTSLDVVKKHLQIELLAMQMGNLSAVGMNLPPNPTEGISLYGRTAERIECEVIPVPVKDFVGKVTATPTDTELRELYNKGKNDLVDPFGKEPGFKIGRKINVQYFVAKAETFLQNEMNKITDEEVQKEYERLVAKNDPMVVEPIVKDNSFVIPGLDSLPGGTLNLEGKGGADLDNAPMPPTVDSPAAPSGGDAPVPPTDGAPVPPSGDAPVAPSGDAPMLPSGDAPVVPSETVPGVGTTPASPGVEIPDVEVPNVVPENSSHSVRGLRAQFVSVQEPVLTPSETSPVAPAGQVVAPAGQVVEQQAGQAVEQAAQAVEQSAAPVAPAANEATASQIDSQPPAATAGSVELPQARPQTGGIGSDIDEEVKKQEAAPERKYKPLTDVAESIRRRLALPVANVKMSIGIEEANHEVEDYFFELDNWEHEGTEDQSTKPTVPDFEALAKKYNLQLKQTGLVDREEMKLDPLGSIEVRNGP